MAKRKPSDANSPDPIKRTTVKYVALPAELWERLKAFADADERSISWAARKAVREFLEKVEGQQ
jgi:predicted transcriptional regulator